MDTPVTRCPLSWPAGWARTARREHARFGTVTRRLVGGGFTATDRNRLTVAQAAWRLERELSRLGAKDPILSTNLRLRIDGGPRSDQPEPADPGAAVYFTLHGKDRCFACDKWLRVADNIGAIAAHVEAIRAVERYGVGNLDQAFAGYTALPATTETSWRTVLGMPDGGTLDEMESRYRDLVKQHHPDVSSGDGEAIYELNRARDDARKELAR